MASSGNNGLFDSSDGAIHTDVDKKNFNVDQAADARSITSIPVGQTALTLYAESISDIPVWFIRKGKVAEAEAALDRLAAKGYDVRQDLERIIEIDREEQALDKSTSYQEIFKSTNLRRTIIACVCFSTIITTGNALANNAAYFMIWCGLAALVGAFASLPILAKCRRRPVYIWAQFISAMLLFLIGFVQLAPYYYE
ncbi:hypothetical protein FOVSG1_010275 [Fusarium oxysporum f. sp. vasinfectum]